MSRAPIYRPGSGVTSGRGTAEDPFVIDAPRVSRIHLLQTAAHVTIRDADVTGGTTLVDAAGIRVQDARNVRIESSRVSGAPAIAIEGSALVIIESSTLTSTDDSWELVFAADSTDLAVRENELVATSYLAFSGMRVANVELAANRFPENASPTVYRLEQSRNVTIRDHDDTARLGGVTVLATNGTTYVDNHARARDRSAFYAYESRDMAFRDSVVEGGSGIALRYGSDARIENVTATTTSWYSGAIDCYLTSNVTIARSEARGDEWGIDADDCDDLAVTDTRSSGVFSIGGSGVVVEGTDVDGIAALGAANVTVRATTIHDAWFAILFSENLTVAGNEFRSIEEGVDIAAGPASTIEGNAFRDMPGRALTILGSDGARVDGNVFHNVSREIVIERSRDLRVDNHTFQRGLTIDAWARGDLRHVIGPNNLVAGRPIRLLHNVTNVTVEPGYAQLFLSESTNVTILAPDLHNVTRAITIADTVGVTIEGGSIVDSGIGIDSSYDRGMMVRGTVLARNGVGAYVWTADGLTLDGASLVGNGHAGLIDLDGRNATLALRDTIVADSKGWGVWAQDGRLAVERSSFTGNGHDPEWSWEHLGFPGDAGLLTSSRNVTITQSRFASNDLGLWAMLGGDATRNHWGCAEWPGAPGCDATASGNEPLALDPWCANDVYAEGWCDERTNGTVAGARTAATARDEGDAPAPAFARTRGAEECGTRSCLLERVAIGRIPLRGEGIDDARCGPRPALALRDLPCLAAAPGLGAAASLKASIQTR